MIYIFVEYLFFLLNFMENFDFSKVQNITSPRNAEMTSILCKVGPLTRHLYTKYSVQWLIKTSDQQKRLGVT